jgi:hypothetical protein
MHADPTGAPNHSAAALGTIDPLARRARADAYGRERSGGAALR